jgi:hypothetical protein
MFSEIIVIFISDCGLDCGLSLEMEKLGIIILDTFYKITMSRLAIPKIVERSRRMSQEVTRGLDADLKDRENAKRDGGLEADCINFLVGLTGIEINDMMEDLKVSNFCTYYSTYTHIRS